MKHLSLVPHSARGAVRDAGPGPLEKVSERMQKNRLGYFLVDAKLCPSFPDDPHDVEHVLDGMMFHVAATLYRVKLQNRVSFQGRRAGGVCNSDTRTITLQRGLNRWFYVLIHELYHAWTFEDGYLIGEEDKADRAASITAAAIFDLINAGILRGAPRFVVSTRHQFSMNKQSLSQEQKS